MGDCFEYQVMYGIAGDTMNNISELESMEPSPNSRRIRYIHLREITLA